METINQLEEDNSDVKKVFRPNSLLKKAVVKVDVTRLSRKRQGHKRIS